MTDPAWLLLVSSVVLIAALAVLSVIDARTYRLPNVITLPLIAAGLLAAVLMERPLWLHGLGAGIGYLALVAIEIAYRRTRGREGLGRGDAKLFAAGGAWCGATLLPMILLAASLSGLLYVAGLKLLGREIGPDTEIPFGPFLALGVAAGWALLIAAPGGGVFG